MLFSLTLCSSTVLPSLCDASMLHSPSSQSLDPQQQGQARQRERERERQLKRQKRCTMATKCLPVPLSLPRPVPRPSVCPALRRNSNETHLPANAFIARAKRLTARLPDRSCLQKPQRSLAVCVCPVCACVLVRARQRIS